MRSTHTTAWPLLLAWVALILYASWFPWDAWTWPANASLASLLQLPWPPWRDRFDEVANLVGYLPFGLLASAVLVRRGWREKHAALAAVAAAFCLSYGVEMVQNLVPSRVPSFKDTVFNTMGAALGASIVVALAGTGWIDRWERTRKRWFERHSAVALTLLLLWPVGLLFPATVPFGLGGGRLDWLHRLSFVIDGTVLEPTVTAWIAAASSQSTRMVLAPEHELAIVALGLLAPCLLAYTLTLHARRRALLAATIAGLALCVTTLSTALSFGPDHAFAWVTPNVILAGSVGMVLAVLSIAVPPRAAGWFALIVLAALVYAVWHAPVDPYLAASLSTWEQGRFIRFHGFAQWVGWLWPYAAFAWLVHRLAFARTSLQQPR